MRLVVLFIGMFLSFSSKAELYSYEKYTLDNGLEVILSPTSGASALTQAIFYKAGRIDEALGKSGVAHFLEHLMFRGDNNTYSSEIEKIGGNTNAYTTQDMTVYYATVPSSYLEQLLKMESLRMNNLSFSDSEFVTEKAVVVQEGVMRYGGSPRAQFMRKIAKLRWLEHPYSVPTIGEEKEFAIVNQQDIYNFYNRYYNPSNAVLVLSGNFNIEEAKQLINKYYGVLQNKAQQAEPTSYELPTASKIRVIEQNDKLKEDMLAIFYNTEALGAENNTIPYSLMLLSEYLSGQGYNAPLYQRLVVKDRLASSVSVDYSGMAREAASFVIFASIKDKKHLPEIEKIIKDELEKIIKTGIPKDKLAILKQVFLANFIYAKEDLFSTANLLGSSAIIGYDINELSEKFMAITNEDIQTAVQELLNDSQEVVSYLTGADND